ncbi:MAG TPA: response regulator transcription factor [Solirubrobacter sp.]
MTDPINVFVVAPVRLYRDGLSRVLADRGHSIVGDASADTCAKPLAAARPDVVLVIADPHVGVVDIRAVIAAAPESRVVALAVPDVEGAIIACAEAGATGFVTTDESIDDLAQAIENAAHNELACSPRITAALVHRLAVLSRQRPPPEPAPCLTRREAEISDFLRRGLSNKEIATHLHIEVATVKNHVHNILDKLGLNRRTEVAMRLERGAARSHLEY